MKPCNSLKIFLAALFILSLFITPFENKAATTDDIYPLKEVSYFPQNYAWSEFWPAWVGETQLAYVEENNQEMCDENPVRESEIFTPTLGMEQIKVTLEIDQGFECTDQQWVELWVTNPLYSNRWEALCTWDSPSDTGELIFPLTEWWIYGDSCGEQRMVDGLYYKFRIRGNGFVPVGLGPPGGAQPPYISAEARAIYPVDIVQQEVYSDLQRIQSLGANTVRIFINPTIFGNFPEPGIYPEYINGFESFLELLDQFGLKAHVTLFDCFGDILFLPPRIQESIAWIEDFVTRYQNDERIAVWELRNEIELNGTQEHPEYADEVRAWLEGVFPALQAAAGDTACTVSVNVVELLGVVRDLANPDPDLYSLHWGPNNVVGWTGAFPFAIDRARELIGNDAILLIGEFGLSTYVFSETTQTNLYQDVLYYANREGVTNLGIWTLNDFPYGTWVAGYNPAQYLPGTESFEQYLGELNIGLYRLDYSAKPAQNILSDAFQGSFPSSLSPNAIHNSSFEELNELYPEYSGTKIYNWQPYDSVGEWNMYYEPDCSRAHSGNCSVKVSAQQNFVVGLYNTPCLRVTGGVSSNYNLQGYVWINDSNVTAILVLSWLDYDYNNNSWELVGETVSNVIYGPTGGWSRLAINGRAPLNADYVQVYAKVPGTNQEQRYVWFDDITFQFNPITEQRSTPLPIFSD